MSRYSFNNASSRTKPNHILSFFYFNLKSLIFTDMSRYGLNNLHPVTPNNIFFSRPPWADYESATAHESNKNDTYDHRTVLFYQNKYLAKQWHDLGDRSGRPVTVLWFLLSWGKNLCFCRDLFDKKFWNVPRKTLTAFRQWNDADLTAD